MGDLLNAIKEANLKIKGAIIVGAHYGIWEETDLRDYGVKDIAFFEPLPWGWNILEANFKGKYPIFNLAVGNENKKVIMHCDHSNGGMSSSILRPTGHLKHFPHVEFVEDREVDMVRLDDFPELDYSKYNFIHLDVQGYELEVLKGAKNIIDNYIDYIHCEIELVELYEGQPLAKDIDSYLTDFNRVQTTWFHETFGDGLYIKKTLCP